MPAVTKPAIIKPVEEVIKPTIEEVIKPIEEVIKSLITAKVVTLEPYIKKEVYIKRESPTIPWNNSNTILSTSLTELINISSLDKSLLDRVLIPIPNRVLIPLPKLDRK